MPEKAKVTMADNITSMANLVADIKRTTKLSENSILKVVEMTLYMAQNSPGAPADLPVDEDGFPLDDEGLPIHPTDEEEPDPEPTEDIAAIEAAAEPEAA